VNGRRGREKKKERISSRFCAELLSMETRGSISCPGDHDLG